MYMFDIVENKLHRYLMAGSWETFLPFPAVILLNV